MSDQNDLIKLIEFNKIHLQKLKEKKAIKGEDAPASIDVEIDLKEKEISDLQDQLRSDTSAESYGFKKSVSEAWEYCLLTHTFSEVTGITREIYETQDISDNPMIQKIGHLYFANMATLRFLGTSSDKNKGGLFIDYLEVIAQLGAAGWEMVSHNQLLDSSSTQTFYFKRRIS